MKRANPTIVGSFVVGAVAVAVAAAIALGAGGGSSRRMPFVVQLPGSVNGLRVGAPVKFKGIEVGAVDRIAIRIPVSSVDPPIAVFCSVDEERLDAALVGGRREKKAVDQLVEAGLRSRLETESFVTGILYISLLFAPEEPGTRHGIVGDVPEVPSLTSSTERLESGIEGLLSKLRELDLGGLVNETRAAVKSVGKIVDSLDPLVGRLSKTIATTDALASELDQGIGDARKLIAHVDQALGPFTSSISTAAGDVGVAARDLSGTLKGVEGTTHPTAPLVVELETALAELSGAAHAARALLEQLERDPSQLLRGRSVPEERSR
jgi:paraquat-inducible protein B